MTIEPYGGFPPHQAHSDTSITAAALIANKVLTLRDKIFHYVELVGGATDEEIQSELHMAPNTQRPRRCELEQQGRISDSGRTRKTRSGRHAVVWVATPGGSTRRLVKKPTANDPKAIDRLLNHAGAIGLLCELSTRIRPGMEQEGDLDSIERCVADFCKVSGGSYRRVLHRIEYFP